MKTLALALSLSLAATTLSAQGMEPLEPIPQVVVEQTAGGFTSGVVVILAFLGLVMVLGQE